MGIIKALSLWQPHAQAIALQLKTFETRGWSTPYRGPLAIHAAQKKFRDRDYAASYYQEVVRQFWMTCGFRIQNLDYGVVLCVVDLVDCVPVGELRGRIGKAEFWGDFRDFGDDGKPRYAMRLENLRVIDAHKRPKVTGRQGFFSVNLGEGLI